MTLQKKAFLIMGMTGLGLIAILGVVSSFLLLDTFRSLEEESIQRSVTNVQQTLAKNLAGLDMMNRDWSGWDATYEFIQDENEDYIRENVVESTFNNLRLNFIVHVRASGEIVLARGYDLKTQEEIPAPAGLLDLITADSPIVKHLTPYDHLSGILALKEGLFLLSSYPITTSDSTGPVRGTLLFGRRLVPEEFGSIGEIGDLTIDIHRLDELDLPPDFAAASHSLGEGRSTLAIQRPTSNEVAGYVQFQDIYGNPVLLLKVSSPRKIYQQGLASARYFVAALMLTSVLLSLLSIFVLNRRIIARMSRLSAAVKGIGSRGDFSGRVPVEGRDEMSQLAQTINRTLDTLSLAQGELRQSQIELQKALAKEKELGELKSRFISTASHEFRNPLTTILISVVLLEKYSGNLSKEKGEELIGRAKTAIDRINQMINDILILGKAEAGKLEFKPEPLDLERFCRDLVEEVQLTEANKHPIELTIDNNSRGDFCADRRLLGPILTNLLSNAAKYSPQGSSIQVRLAYHDGSAIFQVEDHGIGIPLEDQDRLFETFYRADNVGDISGTGLGLSIVKEAVERHGGTISFDSKVDVGTTFTVKIPKQPLSPEPAESSPSSPNATDDVNQ